MSNKNAKTEQYKGSHLTTVRFPPELHRQLSELLLVKREELLPTLSLNDLVVMAVKQYLERETAKPLEELRK